MLGLGKCSLSSEQLGAPKAGYGDLVVFVTEKCRLTVGKIQVEAKSGAIVRLSATKMCVEVVNLSDSGKNSVRVLGTKGNILLNPGEAVSAGTGANIARRNIKEVCLSPDMAWEFSEVSLASILVNDPLVSKIFKHNPRKVLPVLKMYACLNIMGMRKGPYSGTKRTKTEI